MELNTKVNIYWVKRKEKVYLDGKTSLSNSIWDSSLMTRSMALAYASGLMEGLTKGTGKRVKCMEKVFPVGLTKAGSRESTSLASSTALENK